MICRLANNPCREPTRVLVERVFDGDTFVAQGENGEERVRIIGVNTPETGSGDCYAQEAKTFLINQIFGRHVWLTFDGIATTPLIEPLPMCTLDPTSKTLSSVSCCSAAMPEPILLTIPTPLKTSLPKMK